MIERVIYCAASSVTFLASVPNEPLLQYVNGSVVAIQDEPMIRFLSRKPTASLLYFSRDGYRQAIDGLNEKEIKEVIELRLKKWAPQSLNYALGWLALEQRQCLALAVLAQSQSSGADTEVLSAYIEGAFDLLAQLTNEFRYDDVELTALLVMLLERETKLLVELKDALANRELQMSMDEREALMQEERAREMSANNIGEMINRRGCDDFHHSLPYVELTRAVWVRPRDENLAKNLKAELEPYFEYEDGLVCRQGMREITELERAGKKTSVVYLNDGEFIESIYGSTRAQLQRDVQVRVSSSAHIVLASRREFLCGLQLGQILLKKAVRARELVEDKSVDIELDLQIRQETAFLAAKIRQYEIWLPPKIIISRSIRVELLGCEKALLDDAKFFEALAGHDGQPHLAERLRRLIANKSTDLARIESISKNLR